MSKAAIFRLLWLGLGLYISFTLTKSLWELYQASGRLTTQSEKLSSLEKKVAELKDRLDYVRSYEFVEKEARDRLNLQRPGEIVLILPEPDAVLGVEAGAEKAELPNWQKWLRLFN